MLQYKIIFVQELLPNLMLICELHTGTMVAPWII